MVLKIFDLLEAFFERFVPSPLKRLYRLAFRYSVFVFGGLIGWIILIGSEQFLLQFGVWRGLGYGAGITLAILFTFFYHRYITFSLKSEWKERLVKFVPIQLVIAATNWLLFITGTEYMRFPDVPASFVITFFLSLVNFSANKLFIFRRGGAGKSL